MRSLSNRVGDLVLVGLSLELVLVAGFVRPLSIAANPQPIHNYQPPATVLGDGIGGMLRFGVPAAGAFVLLAIAFLASRDVGDHRRGLAVVLGGTLLFSCSLVPTNPVGAQDIYHDVADARTYWLYGQNPAVVPPAAHPNDAFRQFVWVWADEPSAYGPLWYQLSGLPLPLTGDGLWPNVIGEKVLTAAFLLGTTLLTMLIAARLQPGTAAAAGVLVGWNPLLQWETAANGHNDIVMVFFGIASLYALTRRWWVAVFPLLALGIASKHVLVLLAPVVLLWLWRRDDIPRRSILLSLGLGVLLAAELYAPYLAGEGRAIATLLHEGDRVTSSTGAAIIALVMGSSTLDFVQASRLVEIGLGAVYVASYGVLLLRIPRHPTPRSLLAVCFWALFLFLVVAKWWFWPWYVVWLVPLGAVSLGNRRGLVALVFSATAMLTYVSFYWQVNTGDWGRDMITTAATAFVLPLAVATTGLPLWKRRATPVARLTVS